MIRVVDEEAADAARFLEEERLKRAAKREVDNGVNPEDEKKRSEKPPAPRNTLDLVRGGYYICLLYVDHSMSKDGYHITYEGTPEGERSTAHLLPTGLAQTIVHRHHAPVNPHRQRLLNAEVRQAAVPKAKAKGKAKAKASPKGASKAAAKPKAKGKAAPKPQETAGAKAKAKAKAAGQPSSGTAEEKREDYMIAKCDFVERRLLYWFQTLVCRLKRTHGMMRRSDMESRLVPLFFRGAISLMFRWRQSDEFTAIIDWIGVAEAKKRKYVK